MSQGDATISFTGNLADHPELAYTGNGTPYVRLRVLVTGRKFDRESGQWKDDRTTGWRVVAFNGLAELVAESCPKGARVMVTGMVSESSYEDAEGAKRWSTEVIAEEVGLSLKWKGAKVEKTERRSEQAPSAKEDDPWLTQPTH